MLHKLHVLWIYDGLWDDVCGFGNETWKGGVSESSL